jgi:hypothetical protein
MPPFLLGITLSEIGTRAQRENENRFQYPEDIFRQLFPPTQEHAKYQNSPCPLDPRSSPYIRHSTSELFEMNNHNIFVPWLAARLRWGSTTWINPPPKKFDCPYVGHSTLWTLHFQRKLAKSLFDTFGIISDWILGLISAKRLFQLHRDRQFPQRAVEMEIQAENT